MNRIIITIIASLILVGCDNQYDAHDPEFALTDENFQKYSDCICAYFVGSSSASSGKIDVDFELNTAIDLGFWNLHIDKVVYYFDNNPVSTSAAAPYPIKYTATGLASGAHTLRGDVYVSGGNVTSAIIPVSHSFNLLNGYVDQAADVYIDYNYVEEGGRFIAEAFLNEEKTPDGCNITSFSAKWDGNSFGEASSAPFRCSRNTYEVAGSKHDVSFVARISNGTGYYDRIFIIPDLEIMSPTDCRLVNSLLSGTSYFKKNHTLKGRAKRFAGKQCFAKHGVTILFDDEIICASDEFPLDYSIPLLSYSSGKHRLQSAWSYYDTETGRVTSTITNYMEITIED